MYPNQLAPERTNAIRCQYKGINFRSLLQARWACFFDELRWTWQYEPFKMDGYIPDFLVTFSEDHPSIVVDVKPLFAFDYQKNVIEKCKPKSYYQIGRFSLSKEPILDVCVDNISQDQTFLAFYFFLQLQN